MMDWILVMFDWVITGLLDGEFQTTFIYCYSGNCTIGNLFYGKKLSIGSPLKHYILALIIGHVVYVIRKLILLIIFFSCWPIIVISDKFWDFLFLLCNSSNCIIDNLFSTKKRNCYIRFSSKALYIRVHYWTYNICCYLCLYLCLVIIAWYLDMGFFR